MRDEVLAELSDASGPPVVGVSELIEGLREILLAHLPDIRVEGEIRSLHRSRAGHVYFDLVDEGGQLRAAMFRRAAERVAFELEEGMLVRARVHPDVFAARGALQLIVEQLEPAGEGALRVAFERLHRALRDEGLFDEERKRALPRDPRRIGVVTSVQGEAIHDFVRVLRQRGAGLEVVVCDARVQGEGAWRELVRALHLLAAQPGIELIVLTRGGGSLEDLFAFNREELVRAVVELPVPVISAIGHERDLVLCDLAADARAATPTAAAALLAPDRAEQLARLVAVRRRLFQRQAQRLESAATRLEGLRRALVHPAERVAALEQRLTRLAPRLRRGLAATLERRALRLARADERLRAGVHARRETARRRLEAGGARLHALSPLGVLGRGFSLTRRESDRGIVRRAADVAPGDALRIQLAEGSLRARVTDPAEST